VPTSARTPSLAVDVARTAREAFGWTDLRPGQAEAITALLERRDALVVMPTGSGKSAVYQVAALLLDGPTLVVSPLIALQRDQVAALAARDVPEAVVVNSAQAAGETAEAWQAIEAGGGEFLFLSPEQLAREETVERVAALRPSLVVVDEAHCISAWGHDFRPDYLRLGDVLDRLGRPVVAALTATAAPPVRDEIAERLGMRDPLVLVRGFDRPGLHLGVRLFHDPGEQAAAVLDDAAGLPGPGIVYTATRKEAETIAAELAARGRRSAAYHAGLRVRRRREVHDAWLAGDLDVVVATSAFGMGVDKPDVRFVVHARVSDSLDSYYQEIGRAGRDGGPARAVLAHRAEDLGLRRFQAAGVPDAARVRAVLAAVRGGAPVPRQELAERSGLSGRAAVAAVNLLEQAGAVTVDDRGRFVDAAPDESTGELADRAVARAEARRQVERSRLEMMRGYAETTGCRRQFLLGYFGEHLAEPCGYCDTCDSGAASPEPADTAGLARAEAEFPVNARVRHREWGPGVVMRPEPDRVTVLFDEVGYRTLALSAVREEPLLTLEDDGSGRGVTPHRPGGTGR
jgi:ATP-dependent DNA helicase RecQ